jgi:hypothetical protein
MTAAKDAKNPLVYDSENLSAYRLALAFLHDREKDHLAELKLLNKMLECLEDLDRADPSFFNGKQKEIPATHRELKRFDAIQRLKTIYGRISAFKTKAHMKEHLADIKRREFRLEKDGHE